MKYVSAVYKIIYVSAYYNSSDISRLTIDDKTNCLGEILKLCGKKEGDEHLNKLNSTYIILTSSNEKRGK